MCFRGVKTPKTPKNRCHPYIVIATAITDIYIYIYIYSGMSGQIKGTTHALNPIFLIAYYNMNIEHFQHHRNKYHGKKSLKSEIEINSTILHFPRKTGLLL